MANGWKIRNPDLFPISFAQTVLLADETGKPAMLKLCRSYSEARSVCEKFREWRYCLRNAGASLNRAWEIENLQRITTKLVYDSEYHTGWEIWVEVKEQLVKTILELNPKIRSLI